MINHKKFIAIIFIHSLASFALRLCCCAVVTIRSSTVSIWLEFPTFYSLSVLDDVLCVGLVGIYYIVMKDNFVCRLSQMRLLINFIAESFAADDSDERGDPRIFLQLCNVLTSERDDTLSWLLDESELTQGRHQLENWLHVEVSALWRRQIMTQNFIRHQQMAAAIKRFLVVARLW